MIKGVHINDPEAPFLSGLDFRADTAHSRRASDISDIRRRFWLEKLGKLRPRALLAIASVGVEKVGVVSGILAIELCS
jgi:hypothetical protein